MTLAERLQGGPRRASRVAARGRGARPVDAEPLSTPGPRRGSSPTSRRTSPPSLQAGVPVSEAQATFAEAGQMLAIDPPGRRDDRRSVRDRRLRAAAPPLRRAARPDHRRRAGAGRRDRRPRRRPGDQERGRLRPAQARRGVVRDAGRDHGGGGAAASAARLRSRPRCSAATPTRCRRTPSRCASRRWRPRRWTFAGMAMRERSWCASAGRLRSSAPRRSPDEVVEDDEELWAGAAGSRSGARSSSRVHHLPTQLARVLRAAPGGGRPRRHRPHLRPRRTPDAPKRRRWRRSPSSRSTRRPRRRPVRPQCPARAPLMQRVKERFDPDDNCNPGVMCAEPPRAHRRLRPLRLLPADLPDLRPVGGGDGLAARAHRADGRARGGRGLRRARRPTSTSAWAAWPA